MPRVGRLMRGTGILAIVGLVLTACSGTGFNQATATQVMQSVDVNLDSGGAITEVDGSAVYLDELSGESNSSEESFAVEDVVDDLPVRVSTQYKTEDDSGSDLQELEGHTGRVEIDVTVENLTLDSSELTYDVAGESRETPALVGTPLSIAGSVEMAGTRASDIVLDPESESSTNGVVSQTSEGDAVVQWGTVLAPPQSEATTTFQLVADVEDFSAPDFDIAVQAGFHTDMSFQGMMTAAFDTSATSEYGMQQKAIELVADVNDVLTRAGTTITDIRTTLDHTTETLGVDAAEQLRQNSEDMVAEMERVGEQLTALESQVDSSMTGAEAAMNSQLSQIVSSMNGMMGNTEATAPNLMQGEGCAATVEDAESNNSLYSTFLVLGAQLDGYAQGNAECRDEIVQEIENTLGPEVPTAKTCDASDGGQASITCAIFAAQNSVLTSLDDLVQEGERIVQELETRSVDNAVFINDEIGAKLEAIDTRFDDIHAELEEVLNPPEEPSEDGNIGDEPTSPDTTQSTQRDPQAQAAQQGSEATEPGDHEGETSDGEQEEEDSEPEVTWDDLTTAIADAKEELDDLQDLVEGHKDAALEGIDEHVATVREDQKRVADESDDINDRHQKLAQDICALELPQENTPDNGTVDDADDSSDTTLDEKDHLSIQLVGTDCNNNEPTDADLAEGQPLADRVAGLVDDSVAEGLEPFVEEQKEHWNSALNVLDAGNEESAVGNLNAMLTELDDQVQEVRKTSEAETAEEIADLEEEIEQVRMSAEKKIEQIKANAKKKISEVKQGAKEKIERINDKAEEKIERINTAADKQTAGIQDIIDDLEENKNSITESAMKDQQALKKELEELQDDLKNDLPEQIRTAFEEVTAETRDELPENVDKQVRIVSDRVNSARDSVIESYNSTIAGLTTTSDAVINDTSDQIEEQQSTLESQQGETTEALNESTSAVIEGIHQSTASSTRDLEGASAQLGASLNNVILDLGDPDIQGSGILGSMTSSSAMSDTADYQLALASQRAAGYANVRSEDIAEIMLRQAQFSASLEAAATLPAFHLDVPTGARSQTIYAFHIGGDSE